MWRAFLTVLAALGALVMCSDERPHPFEPIHSDATSGRSDADDEEDEVCERHSECDDDELCVDGECMDREEALEECWNDDDCPDGFVCYDELYCIED